MHNPQHTASAAVNELAGTANNPDFWFALIDEADAAGFLDFSVRTVQGLRYRGGGPKFVRLSSRCVKYRRADLREWTESRLQTSTSDAD